MTAAGEWCNFQPSCVTAAKLHCTWPRNKSEVRVDKLCNAPSAVYIFFAQFINNWKFLN